MELHTFVGSPNGRKVEAVIDHLGLKVQVVHHDFPGGLRAADYLAVNPNGMVPTLVDADFTLWESNAIMQYLADKSGTDALYPRDQRRRADVARWQCWELAHFNRAFGTLAFETVAKASLNFGPADDALVATAQADLARFAPVLDGHLGGREYLIGDATTIADYSMITFEGYREAVPFNWAPYPNINRYFDQMRQGHSWVRTAPATRASAGRPAKAA